MSIDCKRPGPELSLSAIRRLLTRDGVALPVEIKRSGGRLTVSLTPKRIV